MDSVQGQYAGRFWALVDRRAGDQACWPWTGPTNHKGYGNFKFGGMEKTTSAHRFAYESATGETLGDKYIDHTCYNRLCCNPSHMRPVTNKQNLENRRGAQKNNYSTGVRGVYEYPSSSTRKKRFQASLKHNGKKVCVGYYATLEEAEAAVIARRLELFTHSDGR